VGELVTMEGQFSYEDFDLLIERGLRGKYRARVVRSPAGESALVQFAVPFTALELENFVLKVGLPRRGTRGPGRPESAPLKDFGGRLYGAVFQDELRDVLLRSLSQTRGQGMGLRLRLRLADTPELAELPWEFLYDPRLNRFLAQSLHTPLVRYLDLPDPPRPLSMEGPLRLLVMISSPAGYPELDAEQEWSLVTGALAQQQEQGLVIVERLAATMSALRGRLRQEQFHVFHFVGHGRYRPDWADGVLVMEDRNEQPHEVTGEELGGLLSEYDATRLAVLNACEGARSGASDPFSGVAQSLIQQGLPAVVAMQFEITDDAAIIFARELYGAIADGYPLEAALAEARGAIRDEGNPTEWGTPVLYSRSPDGRLFELSKRAPIPEVDRRTQEEANRQAQEEADHKAQIPRPVHTLARALTPDTTNPATAVIWGPFIQAAYEQFTSNPGQINPATIKNMPAGYTLVRTIQMTDFFGPVQSRVFYGFVAVGGDPKTAVVALRGMATATLWWDDLHWDLVPFTPVAKGGQVAQGFFEIYRTFGTMTPGQQQARQASGTFPSDVAHAVATGFAADLDPGLPTVVCGHSLGGALATLLVADMTANTALKPQAWTFASPRVGDAAFAARYTSLSTVSWRIYNQVDIVPGFPADNLDNYQHVPSGYSIHSGGSARPNLSCSHALNTYLHVLSPATVPLDPACRR
jgi:hypothetical protein